MKNQKSIGEIIFSSIMGGCMISLIVGLTFVYFIPAIDYLISIVDKNYLLYTYDQFEPFRVSFYSGFMGAFLASLAVPIR